MVPELVKYLEDLSPHLRMEPVRERQILRELYGHLEERVQDLEADGCSRAEAIEQATAQFGRPRAVADAMYSVHATGPWPDAFLAAGPYLGVALLFSLHLWESWAWLAVFLCASVGMTLFGWWRGKPQWMYPWAGFSLVLPLVSGIIALVAVTQGSWGILHERTLGIPVWAYAGLLAYVPLSFGLLFKVMRETVQRDWIFASLMMLPFPVLARWLLSLQMEGSVLVYDRPALAPGADEAIALVFLALAVMPVLFVRLRQRRWKILALIVATPPSFIVAAVHVPSSLGITSLVFFAVLAVVFLLTPALLNQRDPQRRPGYHAAHLLSEP